MASRNRKSPSPAPFDDLLRSSKPRPPSALDVYFQTNPDALALVDRWLELRAAGESAWSANDIFAELERRHGRPCRGPSGFREWLHRRRGGQFVAANGRAQ